ncbi:hypothetical protein HAPAU_32700 [Halalkalicoccus paucihalophilus]|uniref:Uncharacterized protein n=1 Tax=Halalkalicoccus paucihalophilus TaxID=1008153 RepID=A0A151AA95_9EURY|nr:hypothetical protein [Halalkalicoccus paucihalophilus]KYH24287.1 hypothetical protein HAPAU_32700 [Halalkalicoccus paucihalophilus]
MLDILPALKGETLCLFSRNTPTPANLPNTFAELPLLNKKDADLCSLNKLGKENVEQMKHRGKKLVVIDEEGADPDHSLFCQHGG